MMMRSLRLVALLGVLAGLLGAAPSSQPAESPTTTKPAMAELRQNAAHADEALRAAQDACKNRLKGSPQYKAAIADSDAKEQRLAEARKGDDVQAKVEASGAFVNAKKIVDTMTADALDNDTAVASARARVAATTLELHDRERTELKETLSAKMRDDQHQQAAQEKLNNSPVNVAIRKHQIIKGMTEADMRQAMNFHRKGDSYWSATPEITDDGEGSRSFVWSVGYTTPLNPQFVVSRVVRAGLKNGIVVQAVQTILDENAAEPRE